MPQALMQDIEKQIADLETAEFENDFKISRR